jgi:hypothetical protein
VLTIYIVTSLFFYKVVTIIPKLPLRPYKQHHQMGPVRTKGRRTQSAPRGWTDANIDVPAGIMVLLNVWSRKDI